MAVVGVGLPSRPGPRALATGSRGGGPGWPDSSRPGRGAGAPSPTTRPRLGSRPSRAADGSQAPAPRPPLPAPPRASTPSPLGGPPPPRASTPRGGPSLALTSLLSPTFLPWPPADLHSCVSTPRGGLSPCPYSPPCTSPPPRPCSPSAFPLPRDPNLPRAPTGVPV